MKKLCLFLIAVLIALPTFSFAGEPLFQYGSLRKNEANVRRGPGTQYPIVWVYKRYGWPVEILAEYQSWYKIRDVEGEEGWIYRSLLSSRRTAIVSQGEPITMFKKQEGRGPIYKFEAGVIVELIKCGTFQCNVSYNSKKGWVMKDRLLMLGDVE